MSSIITTISFTKEKNIAILQTKEVRIFSYIKNDSLEEQLATYYRSMSNNFSGLKVIYAHLNNEKFYKDFRKKGTSFLNDYMKKHKVEAVIFIYQKKIGTKIKILTQKARVNVSRNNRVSMKYSKQDIILKQIISSSLKHLGEILIISPQGRRL